MTTINRNAIGDDEAVLVFDRVSKVYSRSAWEGAGFKELILRPHLLFQRRPPPARSLNELSLCIRRGEFFGLIGQNGSGKSTTLSLAAGVLEPTDGCVVLHGRVAPLLELGAGFHPELTGRDNIILNAVLLGMTRREVRERYTAIAEFSGLGDALDRTVRTYSSGMVARLGFSVAAHLDADLILLDEILAVGDGAFQEKCLERLAMMRQRGAAIIFVGHDMATIRRHCTRAGFLRAGQLLKVGDPDEVIAAYMQTVPATSQQFQ